MFIRIVDSVDQRDIVCTIEDKNQHGICAVQFVKGDFADGHIQRTSLKILNFMSRTKVQLKLVTLVQGNQKENRF